MQGLWLLPARFFALARNVFGTFIGSKAEIDGMSHFAFGRPFGELHLGNE